MTNETEAPERTWAADGYGNVTLDLSEAKDARIAEYEVRLRELETKLQAVATERDQLSDAFVNLQSDFEAAEAKLAKAVDALEHEVKRSRRHLAGSTLDTLADLQKPIATRDDPA